MTQHPDPQEGRPEEPEGRPQDPEDRSEPSRPSGGQAPVPALLSEDFLVMQQQNNVMAIDFQVLDRDGNLLGLWETVGSGAARFFLGSRHLRLSEADGTPLAQIVDTVSWGRDRFEVTWPDGSPLAHVVKKMRLLSTAVEAEIVDGPVLEVSGDFLGHDFRYLAGDVQIGEVSRQWPGLGRGLLGHSRYGLAFRPDVTPRDRLALIGTTVALDLIRAKARRSRSN